MTDNSPQLGGQRAQITGDEPALGGDRRQVVVGVDKASGDDATLCQAWLMIDGKEHEVAVYVHSDSFMKWLFLAQALDGYDSAWPPAYFSIGPRP